MIRNCHYQALILIVQTKLFLSVSWLATFSMEKWFPISVHVFKRATETISRLRLGLFLSSLDWYFLIWLWSIPTMSLLSSFSVAMKLLSLSYLSIFIFPQHSINLHIHMIKGTVSTECTASRRIARLDRHVKTAPYRFNSFLPSLVTKGLNISITINAKGAVSPVLSSVKRSAIFFFQVYLLVSYMPHDEQHDSWQQHYPKAVVPNFSQGKISSTMSTSVVALCNNPHWYHTCLRQLY